MAIRCKTKSNCKHCGHENILKIGGQNAAKNTKHLLEKCPSVPIAIQTKLAEMSAGVGGSGGKKIVAQQKEKAEMAKQPAVVQRMIVLRDPLYS